ncbi:MAG TPA: NAD(P)H-dependent glycerol-3-phosphate dehydrogenase [Desulfobacterales bacterium]|nr:NAD(P)H-dependent glycerol-3-phosphate dehydrogenase [Desulfobacterales bacterium]
MGGEFLRVAVIGGGSWGTTLARLLALKGLEVSLWAREKEVVSAIHKKRENTVFLPGIRLPESLKATQEMEEALEGKEIILMVVPSQHYREVLTRMRPSLNGSQILVTATKGIENETLMIMSQVTEDVVPGLFTDTFSCLAGPSFAKEVCQGFPTAVTIASKDQGLGKTLQTLFSTDYFRAYVSDDIVGAQLAGALKNVIAIAAGASDGLGFGHNARAALITRGLAEIRRLGVAMGAHPMTFAGLAGVGDLVLTCTGDLSRNRTVGLQVGKGMNIQEITSHMKMVAEGVKTTKSAYQLSKKMGVEMPITEQVYQILYEGKQPREAVRELMTRALKWELDLALAQRP